MHYAIRPIRSSEDLVGLTEELRVDDLRTGKRYVVMTQRVDFRPIRTTIGTGVARFTEKAYAFSETGDIQLRTPAFYRMLEDGDDLDGAQAANFAPVVAAHLRKSGIPASENYFTAEGTIASSKEPWIFCTSLKPSHAAGATSLERQFSSKGPDAVVTTVDDHNAFARQLGIDVARSVKTERAVKNDGVNWISRHQYWLACGTDKEIQAVVQVIHGPVNYNNSTLTLRTDGDLTKEDPYRIWFTKRSKFSGEREYRFVVLAGYSTTDTFRLDVSPELSRLTTSWRFGDKWWSS